MPRHDGHSRTLVVFGDSLSDNGNLLALIGLPQPPDWQGRFSNGPTYAEQLAQDLGMRLEDRAFGDAEASDASLPLLGIPLPINLSNQLAGYLADLHGHKAAPGTTAVINIGSNDYISYLESSAPKDPQTAQTVVLSIVGAIDQAVTALTQAGVDKIALFTLPDFGVTPGAQALGPQAAAFAHALDVANNAALAQVAAHHPNVQLVDIFEISEALAADPRSFGFTAGLGHTWVDQLIAGSTAFAPNEVAFFNDIHPTTAAHGVLAAFADAAMTSDSTRFLDGTASIIHAGRGDNFIFATPIDASNHVLNANYTIDGGAGDDIIYAGSGNVTVHGGAGDDLVFAGAGNATLYGDSGADVLETNSTGINRLIGGSGGDALIANRAGTNALIGDRGDDLFVLKENAGLVEAHGAFNFGQQLIAGGGGHDTLRFVINDQQPLAEQALIDEFRSIEAAFDAGRRHGHAGSFDVDGLHISGIERIELQIDSVSKDPNTPYLVIHHIALADGFSRGEPEGQHGELAHLLQVATQWNLLTV